MGNTNQAVAEGAGLYCLDGSWETGRNRRYDAVAPVPGLATDPNEINPETLWYKKELTLPQGSWTHATLLLNGARFCPAVYVNGTKVSEAGGGMTVTAHPLSEAHVAPGETIVLEIALRSLTEVDASDASRIPEADRWRSNVSSSLWDSVYLSLHGSARISRIIPFYEADSREVAVHWEAVRQVSYAGRLRLRLQVWEEQGGVVAEGAADSMGSSGRCELDWSGPLQLWSHDRPYCYKLKVSVMNGEGLLLDRTEMTLGLKDFRVDGIGFRLNGNPVTLRMGSVVWHRWLRNPEARELAFDTEWFRVHVAQRLKDYGANGLRFHLGTPPEALLDLCDRLGLMVQIEWLFFHGMNASLESLLEQWRNWLDLCMRHPCVCLVHAWNETEGDSLQRAYQALALLSSEYPPLVVGHRDVLHTHKYWWSLFENLGLYFDSAGQFAQPVVADEFGGNYLDGEGKPGAYPAVRESLLRFLGHHHTTAARLQLHRQSNTQIAEYWRRLGIAGFSPFCLLGSPEDGNSHFLGPLREANPMPVWAGLTAAYSPVSVSLEVWDRNYAPGQQVELPLYFFNESPEAKHLHAEVRIVSDGSREQAVIRQSVDCELPAYGRTVRLVSLRLPETEGQWRYEAELLNRPSTVMHPVVSRWEFQTVELRVPEAVRHAWIGLPAGEEELADLLQRCRLQVCGMEDPRASVILVSPATWGQLLAGSMPIRNLEQRMKQGCSVILLNAGPQELGQADVVEKHAAMLEDTFQLPAAQTVEWELPFGIRAVFKGMPEPESCVHPALDNNSLWRGMEPSSTWLWNGLRGGLIVPARDMEFDCLSPSAFLALWQSRGADPAAVQGSTPYYAFELAGFYAYARECRESPGGKRTVEELREKVRFLVEDAPSLQNAVDPHAPVREYDLTELYQRSNGGHVSRLVPLACAGKNLTRTPVVMMELQQGCGRLLVSQLLMKGRLAPGYGQDGLYGVRYDPAACQMVLNMIHAVLPDPVVCPIPSGNSL